MMPIPYDAVFNQAVADTDGGTDFLVRFWQSPYARSIAFVQVSLSPTSSAGVYRSDGPPISSATDGMFFPAGGGVIYLQSYDEVRHFRIRANLAGAIVFSAQAYRFAGPLEGPGRQVF